MLNTWVECHCEVDNCTEDTGGQKSEWQLRDDLGPEVGAHIVHIVVHFAKENRSLVREDQNNILNSVERYVHCHEEKGTLQVLESLVVSCACAILDFRTDLPEEQSSKACSHTSSDHFDVGSLGQADQVKEVTLGQQVKLEAPRSCAHYTVNADRFAPLSNFVAVVVKVASLVGI